MNNITLGTEGIEKIQQGVDKVANAVKVTLGPKGQNVIIEKQGQYPVITKDGVSVARSITLSDRLENMGAAMVIQAANKTVEEAGDSTTTCCVLTQALISYGLKQIRNGASPQLVAQGMLLAYNDIIKQLKSNSIEVNSNEQLRQVATISANNDKEIGDLIFDALEKVTAKGQITFDFSKTGKTYVNHEAGTRLTSGFVHPYFVNDPYKNRCFFEGAFVLILNDTLSVFSDIVDIVEKVFALKRPLLIIAKDVEGEALSTLANNAKLNNLKVCVIFAPSSGSMQLDIMEDLRFLTGATVVGLDSGIPMNTITIDHLGKLESCIITETDSLLVGGKGAKKNIDTRVKQLRSQITEDKTKEQKEILEDRIAKISGGVAVINAGGVTEMEMKQRFDRIEDAVKAVKAASEEGISIGGGSAFLKCKPLDGQKDDVRVGYLGVFEAIKAPFLQILENAAINDKSLVDKITDKKPNYGYNVISESIEDLIETGIVDSTKVLRVALENAVSVSTIFITTGAVISIQ